MAVKYYWEDFTPGRVFGKRPANTLLTLRS